MTIRFKSTRASSWLLWATLCGGTIVAGACGKAETKGDAPQEASAENTAEVSKQMTLAITGMT